MNLVLLLIAFFSFVVASRAYAIRPRRKTDKERDKPLKKDGYTVAVFLGSGGHTTEALKLLSALDFKQYRRRVYLVSSGDALSIGKVRELESVKGQAGDESVFDLIELPRARRVHQSLLSTPPTFIRSLAAAIYHISILPGYRGEPLADALILNGPGTCVSVVTAVWISRFIGLKSPRIIYIESFARVKTLSLSGKVLRRLVDR
ncbi:UDP-N-acetylglucosamine transferase subunit [Tulasnella sp. JGI-2019a]|nr:UDP-N-acetylglucosamine transferase subunit [Tulasnella sp. JGI-2019a]KAG9005706.1 UDP-N-acetylglucosamine transferase subunit [Tulasnella sp. JGI-2019a]